MRRCRVAFVFALLFVSTAQAQSDFPYDRDLVLDARPMRGGKRIPILTVGADGQAQIDLWCKRGQGQAVIAGETVTIIVGAMRDETCTAERQQADEQLIATLSAVTNWSFRGDVVAFSGGGMTLRFRAAAN